MVDERGPLDALDALAASVKRISEWARRRWREWTAPKRRKGRRPKRRKPAASRAGKVLAKKRWAKRAKPASNVVLFRRRRRSV
jgi:hypothetical protein